MTLKIREIAKIKDVSERYIYKTLAKTQVKLKKKVRKSSSVYRCFLLFINV